MDVIFLTLYVIPDNFDTSTYRHHVVSLYVTQITIDYKTFKLKKITMIILNAYLSIRLENCRYIAD